MNRELRFVVIVYTLLVAVCVLDGVMHVVQP